ncbi:MAG: nuclear transport factor 2 family protein [Trebonia sp.]
MTSSPTAVPEADSAPAAMTQAADDEVLAPLRAYIRGHATGDPAHFRAAFLPTAHVEGIREGTFVSWCLDDYCALFHGQPAPDESTRSRRIDAVSVHGSVAMASMTLEHGADTFTDVFLLVCVSDACVNDADGVDGDHGRWRIANKAYHRH